MIVICCVDDRFGLAFNKRRCSSDAAVTQDILNRIGDCKLHVDTYSAKLFGDSAVVVIDEDPLASAGEGEYVFCEKVDPASVQNKIEKAIIYFWNRRYPSDVKLTLNPDEWDRVQLTEFVGHSHEKITVEEWTRKE